ncbi:MAG: hypothetical protein KBT12_03435 [Bacteroidales bacterium]|nr:hypothetical protein [Candidatus Physcousia equi]
MSYIGTYKLTHMKFLNGKQTIEEIVADMDEEQRRGFLHKMPERIIVREDGTMTTGMRVPENLTEEMLAEAKKVMPEMEIIDGFLFPNDKASVQNYKVEDGKFYLENTNKSGAYGPEPWLLASTEVEGEISVLGISFYQKMD